MTANVIAYITTHWTSIVLAAGVVLSPAVMTMPSQLPRTLNEWWFWFHDYCHALTNSRNPDAFTRRETVLPPKF